MASDYTWSGPQPGYKDLGTRTKGIMRKRRDQKRKEAEERNARTPVERTKQYRLNPPESEELESASREDEGLS